MRTRKHQLMSWLKVCWSVSSSGAAISRNMKEKNYFKDGEQQNLPGQVSSQSQKFTNFQNPSRVSPNMTIHLLHNMYFCKI